MSNGYGKKRYPIRSCGKRHGYCKACRPDINYAKNNAVRYSGKPIVGSSVPFPKTQWERHIEEHDVAPMENKYLYIGELPSRKPYTPPTPKKPLEEVIKEIEATGRDFTRTELRQYFGFDSKMVVEYLRRPTQSMVDKQAQSAEREKRIIEMRLTRGTTLKDIAENEGVSRERIRQILVAAEIKYGISLPKGFKGGFPPKDEPLMVAVHCKVCGKIMECPETEIENHYKNLCDEHKMGKYGYNAWVTTGAQWWKMSDREQDKWRYNHDEKRRLQCKRATKAWVEKIKKDPVKWARYKAQQYAAVERYYQRKKEKNKPKPRPFIVVPDTD